MAAQAIHWERQHPHVAGIHLVTKLMGGKDSEHAPFHQHAPHQRQIARLRALAGEAQLDPEFSEKFLRFIIDEVIRHHEQAKTGN